MITAAEASKELTEAEEISKFAIVALDTSRFVMEPFLAVRISIMAFDISKELTEAEEKLKFVIVALDTSKDLIEAAETSKISIIAFDTSRKLPKVFVIVALDTSRFVIDAFGEFMELAVRGPITTADMPSIDVPVTTRFVSVDDELIGTEFTKRPETSE